MKGAADSEAGHRDDAVAGPGALHIRKCVQADVSQLVSLEQEIFVEDAWSPALMREELLAPQRSYFVLVDSAGVVYGYAGLLTVGIEADVQTIAVAPAARGMGWGRKLLQALLDAAELAGAEQVFLEVREDNAAARQLYISAGFVELGVRPGYYQPAGVDAIVMRWMREDADA